MLGRQSNQPVLCNRRNLLLGGACGWAFTVHPLSRAVHAGAGPPVWVSKLVRAGRTQIGVTTEYDGSYVRLAFPGGDIPRELGVCTDVIIRAYRDAFGFDLQKAVNADMSRNFRAYPKTWGLRRPDRNIDHRRVPNLQTFFRRNGAELSRSSALADYAPGDLITQMLGGRLPHIGIISDRRAPSGRLMLIHNIGAGTQEEDVSASFPVTGHYSFKSSSAI